MHEHARFRTRPTVTACYMERQPVKCITNNGKNLWSLITVQLLDISLTTPVIAPQSPSATPASWHAYQRHECRFPHPTQRQLSQNPRLRLPHHNHRGSAEPGASCFRDPVCFRNPNFLVNGLCTRCNGPLSDGGNPKNSVPHDRP